MLVAGAQPGRVGRGAQAGLDEPGGRSGGECELVRADALGINVKNAGDLPEQLLGRVGQSDRPLVPAQFRHSFG